MNILLNIIGGSFHSYGSGPIESFLGFILTVVILYFFIKALRAQKTSKNKLLEPAEYQKDILGIEKLAYHTFSGTFKPMHKSSMRIIFIGLVLITSLTFYFINTPNRQLEAKNSIKYVYVDSINNFETSHHYHVYSRSHINIKKYPEFENIFPQYPHQPSFHPSDFLWGNTNTVIYETPKYRKIYKEIKVNRLR